jgi:hypothetical protein
LALVLWVAVLAGITVASQAVGSDYHNDFSVPGTESQRALDSLRAHAPGQAGDTVQVVVQDSAGVRTPMTGARVEAMLDDLRGLPHVADVRSPYADAAAVSRDGTTAYATVTLDGPAQDVPTADIRRMIDAAKAAEGDGLRVELGGDAVRGAEESEGGAAEGAGLPAAVRRGRDRPVRTAAGGRVPLAAHPDQGGTVQPAQRRRLAGRHRAGVPAGPAGRAAQRGARTDRGVRPRDDLRHRLWAVDGLRGVPALAHA